MAKNYEYKKATIADIDELVRTRETLINWEHPKVCVNLQTDVR